MAKKKYKIRIIEKPSMSGKLFFTVYKNGVPIKTFEEMNLVVNSACQQIAHLVAGDVLGRSIDRIAVGTSANMPTVNDTEITEPFKKQVDSFEYPVFNQVKINFKLEMSEANNMIIREFGLLTVDGKLFARRITTEPIHWESDVSIVGEWLLIFRQES